MSCNVIVAGLRSDDAVYTSLSLISSPALKWRLIVVVLTDKVRFVTNLDLRFYLQGNGLALAVFRRPGCNTASVVSLGNISCDHNCVRNEAEIKQCHGTARMLQTQLLTM